MVAPGATGATDDTRDDLGNKTGVSGKGGETAPPKKEAGDSGADDAGSGLHLEGVDPKIAEAISKMVESGVLLTQATFDKNLQERLQREQRKQEAAEEKGRQQQQLEALQNDGKWEELAKTRATTITKLEAEKGTLENEVEQYRDLVGRIITAESKNWNITFRRSDPGADKPLERLQWYNLMRGPAIEWAKAQANGNGSDEGANGATPPPNGGGAPSNSDAEKQRMKQKYIEDRVAAERARGWSG